jgi:signal peptidase I
VPKRRAIAWGSVIGALVILALLPFIFIRYGMRTYSIVSGAMEPALRTHDVVLAEMATYRYSEPREGDIVVFRPPIVAANVFIKRIIGLPGDTLRVHDGIFYRNGKAMSEPYAADKAHYEVEVRNYGVWVDGVKLDPQIANVPPRGKWTAPNRIPDGCYWMAGDTRNNSEDSHVWGFAQRSGTFSTGPRAGQEASFTARAFALVKPQGRLLK